MVMFGIPEDDDWTCKHAWPEECSHCRFERIQDQKDAKGGLDE